MGQPRVGGAEQFEEYVKTLGDAIGHADRRKPLREYLTGLLLAGERKSVEPMAAKIDPLHVPARHQSMHHFVANAPWKERAVLEVAREYALGQLERHSPVAAWAIDDTGMPKKGTHSVGVAHQYCGVLGKSENCQVAVTISLVNNTMSVPCAYRLYLPESWARNRARRAEARIPAEVRFRTKWEIALEEVDQMLTDGLPQAPVVADAGYGVITEFRDGITARGLSYAVGISKQTTVWPPGREPLPPRSSKKKRRGRPARLLRRGAEHRPVSVLDLAKRLPPTQWRSIAWREGTRGTMRSRFAVVRVRPAHRDNLRSTPREPEWLVIEWPRSQPEPTKYWLSTAPQTAPVEDLIGLIKIRWRIERDFEELKDEIGLDHFEGRSWRGFHHHGALSIAAYAFLAAERARLSPPEPLAFLGPARLPKGFRPRGAALSS
ncbi:MAG: IS701 family transposase [Candidatus Binatia bacterium]